MQIDTTNAIHFTPVLNPQELLAKVDAKVFEQYRKGAELNANHAVTPHRWWLSKPGNKEDILYQWPEGATPGEAFFAFAQKDASERAHGRSRHNAIRASRDLWLYDESVYQEYANRWNQALACAKQFNDLAGSRKLNLSTLKEFGLHLVRSLKRGNAYPMLADKVPAYEDLCAMGLAAVKPSGYIEATDTLKKLRIPNAATLSKTSPAH